MLWLCGFSNDGRLPILPDSLFNSTSTQVPLVQVVRDFDAAWLLPSEHVVLVVCQWCRCVLGAWTQWPWIEAVCPDISQNLASLDTCHVMFLDVATTMLRKFMYFLSVFFFPFVLNGWMPSLLFKCFCNYSLTEGSAVVSNKFWGHVPTISEHGALSQVPENEANTKANKQ